MIEQENYWRSALIAQMRRHRSWFEAEFLRPTGSAPPVLPMRVGGKPREESRRISAETCLVPAVELLVVDVPATASLVSQAARRFWQETGRLPDKILLSPLRWLAAPKDFHQVDGCEDIGLFTIEVECDLRLTSDTVRCVNHFWRTERVFYL